MVNTSHLRKRYSFTKTMKENSTFEIEVIRNISSKGDSLWPLSVYINGKWLYHEIWKPYSKVVIRMNGTAEVSYYNSLDKRQETKKIDIRKQILHMEIMWREHIQWECEHPIRFKLRLP